MSLSTQRSGAFSPRQCGVNRQVTYSSIVKTYSYHTLKIKWHSIYPHCLKWSDCFSRQTAAELHSNRGIKDPVKSSVKWNLRAITSVTLTSSNDFVPQRTFQGVDGGKSWTEGSIKKMQHSGTAEIKSPSFLGTFFFFLSPERRTRSVALWCCILMQVSFHLSVNKMQWTGTWRSIVRSRLLPFFISSVYYLQHDRHQPRLTVDWAASQYALVATCHKGTGWQNDSQSQGRPTDGISAKTTFILFIFSPSRRSEAKKRPSDENIMFWLNGIVCKLESFEKIKAQVCVLVFLQLQFQVQPEAQESDVNLRKP